MLLILECWGEKKPQIQMQLNLTESFTQTPQFLEFQKNIMLVWEWKLATRRGANDQTITPKLKVLQRN